MIDRKSAKELLHIRDWLDLAVELVSSGRAAYDADPLRQEAGDSLMMKIGEAASRLARAESKSPKGVDWRIVVANRNWLIHQYDRIDRDITWATLTKDLPALQLALATYVEAAEELLQAVPPAPETK